MISDVVDRTLTQVRGSILKLPIGRQRLYDNRYGTPMIANFPSGWQPVSAGFPCRNVFFVQSNMLALQKVSLSFALVAFRSGQQSTSAGGSAHSHTVADHTHTTPSHDHQLAANGGAAATPTIYGAWNFKATAGGTTRQVSVGVAAGTTDDLYTWAAGGSATSAAGGAQTSGADSTHTHNLNAPNAIYETGLATGCTVILDGTTILAGPYNTDQNEIDITSYVTGSGKHEIQITSTALGGIFGHVQVVGLVKAY